MPGPEHWGVESERDMYFKSKRSTGTTRLFGLGAVLAMNALVFWVLVSGFGAAVVKELTETEVAIIDVPEVEDEEPPPPPPVDVELPPPPPQVVLPEFTFDVAPSENAIKKVEAAKEPVREARPAPPPPQVTIASKPSANSRRFEKPEYPSASIRAEEEGDVTVSACVDTAGKMTNIQLVKSSGFERLDNAVLKGLPRTRVDPAKGTDGKPIAFCSPPYVFTIEYNLEEAR
jgi:periplasmic protein TonB